MVEGNCGDCGAEFTSKNHRFCEQCGSVLTASSVGPKEEVNKEELSQNIPPSTKEPTPRPKRDTNETYKIFGVYGESEKTKRISGNAIFISGFILIVAAAVTFFALRSNSADEVSSQNSNSADEASSQNTVSEESCGPAQTEPVANSESVLHPPAEVRVLVANGTDVAGAAGAIREVLISDQGYNGLPAVIATTEEVPNFSCVYYANGYELDAKNVGLIIGVDSAHVLLMPAALPVADLAEANVLVLLGSDLYPS